MLYDLLVKHFATEQFYEYIELAIQLEKFRQTIWKPGFREAGEDLILDEMDGVWSKLGWIERRLVERRIKNGIFQK